VVLPHLVSGYRCGAFRRVPRSVAQFLGNKCHSGRCLTPEHPKYSIAPARSLADISTIPYAFLRFELFCTDQRSRILPSNAIAVARIVLVRLSMRHLCISRFRTEEEPAGCSPLATGSSNRGVASSMRPEGVDDPYRSAAPCGTNATRRSTLALRF
jgi:hypothetical protein